MVCSQNPIFPLILNDFGPVFKTMALRYFSQRTARKTSLTYYRQLYGEIRNGSQVVEKIVKDAMQESIRIWRQIKVRQGGKP